MTTENSSVLDEMVRLDKIVRDLEHALLVLERLRARGRCIPEKDAQDVRDRLAGAIRERDWLEAAVGRYTEKKS